MAWVELRTVLALTWLLLAPGGCAVSWFGVGKAWAWPSRLALTVTLSAVFYPLLFYLLPWMVWDSLALWGLLLLLTLLWGVAVWRHRAAHAQPPNSHGPEFRRRIAPRRWAAWLDVGFMLLLALTLYTRWAIAHRYPFPAWTDSLHHTLLTHLTATQGALPASLLPYFPVELEMYHLGLYALAAPVVWLAQVPAHTALLWTAQTLNGLVGLGVYLVLERAFAASPFPRLASPAQPRSDLHQPPVHAGNHEDSYKDSHENSTEHEDSTEKDDTEQDKLGEGRALWQQRGRLAGLVGAVVAGLLAFQPAFYVNWGRFTQLAAQIVLPVAWWVSCWAVMQFSRGEKGRQAWPALILAALLNAGVFLLHFRVAVFYALWLLPGLAMGLLGLVDTAKFSRSRAGRGLAAGGGLALLTLLLLGPVLWPALADYIAPRAGVTAETVRDPAQAAAVRAAYFDFPWAAFFDLALHRWLAGITLLSALVGLLRRNAVAIGALLWMALLLGLGHTYLLGISLLNVTNLGAVLILFYLPAALIIGAAAAELVAWVATGGLGANALPRAGMANIAACAIAGAVLVGALVSAPRRVQAVEPYRFFVTPQDEKAMQWIRTHTPEDALFAVNTVFWLPKAPHGTDAGYWLPYLAERETTAGVMLLELADPDYAEQIVALSQAVQAVAADPAAVVQLGELGVDYIYAGALGNYEGPNLDVEQLAAQPQVELVYQDGAVGVLRLRHAGVAPE